MVHHQLYSTSKVAVLESQSSGVDGLLCWPWACMAISKPSRSDEPHIWMNQSDILEVITRPSASKLLPFLNQQCCAKQVHTCLAGCWLHLSLSLSALNVPGMEGLPPADWIPAEHLHARKEWTKAKAARGTFSYKLVAVENNSKQPELIKCRMIRMCHVTSNLKNSHKLLWGPAFAVIQIFTQRGDSTAFQECLSSECYKCFTSRP